MPFWNTWPCDFHVKHKYEAQAAAVSGSEQKMCGGTYQWVRPGRKGASTEWSTRQRCWESWLPSLLWGTWETSAEKRWSISASRSLPHPPASHSQQRCLCVSSAPPLSSQPLPPCCSSGWSLSLWSLQCTHGSTWPGWWPGVCRKILTPRTARSQAPEWFGTLFHPPGRAPSNQTEGPQIWLLRVPRVQPPPSDLAAP